MTITKLTALERGDPSNSNGADVASSVNELIDDNETNQLAITGLNTSTGTNATNIGTNTTNIGTNTTNIGNNATNIGNNATAIGNNTNDINALTISSVIPQTVSGLLTAGGRINQIRDSGAFTMPLANSVADGVILVVELPRVNATETPSNTTTGGDLFEDENGTDTVINWVGAARLTLTSNGSNKWSL